MRFGGLGSRAAQQALRMVRTASVEAACGAAKRAIRTSSFPVIARGLADRPARCCKDEAKIEN
jgi:hypothetical protein